MSSNLRHQGWRGQADSWLGVRFGVKARRILLSLARFLWQQLPLGTSCIQPKAARRTGLQFKFESSLK